MRYFGAIVAGLLLFVAASAASFAADAQTYFGEWRAGNCVLRLKGPDLLNRYVAETSFCTNNWAFASTWAPTSNGITVMTMAGERVGTMSLENGDLILRLSNGKVVAFRRVGGAPPPDRGLPARQESRIPVTPPDPYVAGFSCVKRGAGNACASAYDLGLPRGLPYNSTRYTRPANVMVFGPLNFRAKIGFDQKIHFTIPGGLCVPVWACFDQLGLGPWCVTRLNGQQGYIAKFNRRPDGSMQVNYGNGCAG